MHQSANSLALRASMAADFVAEAWPQARERAWGDPGFDADSIESVVICGCGDSYHAALSLEFAIAAWSGWPVRAAHAMGAARYLLTQFDGRAANALMVCISASGEVARTLEALEQAKVSGFRTLALTTQEFSSLASTAECSWATQVPDLPVGPGLLSHLGSLLMGYALAGLGAEPSQREAIDQSIARLPAKLVNWQREEEQKGRALADEIDPQLPLLYLGSGPAYGSALFAAAKAVEAAGISAWGQDVEEWTHVEYFSDPSHLPIWMLSSGGRSRSREQEVLVAATAIGRQVLESNWEGDPEWTGEVREALAPMMLWAGPAAFAGRLMERLSVRSFRGFAGGRSQEEGGGISRIRTSWRLSQEITPPDENR